MFKLAAGIQIANFVGKSIELDIGWFKFQRQNSGLDIRQFELNYFPNISGIPQYQSSKLVSYLNGNYNQYRRRFRNPNLTVTEQNYHLLYRFGLDKVRYINDSFEDIEFLPSKDVLKNLFAFSDNKSPWLDAELSKLDNDCGIAIHVRMGDYLNFSSLYGVLDYTYYRNSLQILKEKLGACKVTLFSDDPKKAISFLGSGVRIDHVQEYASAPESLELLSNFSGIIAANSTFSWWAGYLGNLNGTCKFTTLPSLFLKDYPIKDKLKFENSLIVPANNVLS